MIYHRIRIVEPVHCPQCHGRMTRYTNGQGRGWKLCVDCGAQIPTESGFREVKNGVDKGPGNSGGTEDKA